MKSPISTSTKYERVAEAPRPVLLGAARWALCFGLGMPGCRCSEAPPTPEPVSVAPLLEVIGRPLRIAAGDLDGDGRPDLVMADAALLRVIDLGGRQLAQIAAPGGIQVLRVADLDGDGRAEILAGWGRTREHPEARARASIYHLEEGSLREQIVEQPATTRQEIVELLPFPTARPPALLFANFESKYMVRIAKASLVDGQWAVAPMATIRTATSFAIGDVDGDGEPDLVVGRVYGDDLETDGDAFVLRPDGTRIPIPVMGGVRSLELADLDGDGRLEILLGDGWNRDYGKLARARLTRAWWDAGEFRTELVEESPGQYTLWSVLTADLDADGRREIVTRGNEQIRLLSRKADIWEGSSVASHCHDAVAVDVDPRPGQELLLLCDDGARIIGR